MNNEEINELTAKIESCWDENNVNNKLEIMEEKIV